MTRPDRWTPLGLTKPKSGERPASGTVADVLFYALARGRVTDPIAAMLAGIEDDAETLKSAMVENSVFSLASTAEGLHRRIRAVAYLLDVAEGVPVTSIGNEDREGGS